jgi:cell wall-associated NlpC family hydrolase
LFSSCQIWQNIKYRLFSNREKTQITSFSSQEIDQILKSANGYRGTPYRTGGSDLKGMDCSGLIFRIYQDQGFLIPRIANEQANFGLPVPLDQLKKGDWIFFATGNTKIINHLSTQVLLKVYVKINF